MLKNVKKTVSHSAIYGLGNLTTKLIGIVLLPLYTKHISVAEYGVLGILEATIMIMVQVMVLGQAQTFLRFHELDDYAQKQKSLLFTLFVFLSAVTIIFGLVGAGLSNYIGSFFAQPELFALYFRLSFLIVGLRIIGRLLLSTLRIKERPVFFATVNVIKLTVSLVLNIYFIAYLHLGILGILYAYVAGDALLLVMILPINITYMKPHFESKIVKAALVFGLPLILSGLATMLLNTGNRYILKLLSNYQQVGLYNLGYKIAGFINVFLIQSFNMGFLPLAYKMYGNKGDKRYFIKMLTYFTFALCWTGLALSMYSEELVKVLGKNSDYWPAWTIVPILTLAFVFEGGKTVTSLGSFLMKKTAWVSYTTLIALAVSIALNFLLIPSFGIIGASLATLIASIILYILSQWAANKFFPVRYENLKIVKMIAISIGLFLIPLLFPDLNFGIKVVLKLLLIMAFPFILLPLGFYEPVEIEKIKLAFIKILKFGKKS